MKSVRVVINKRLAATCAIDLANGSYGREYALSINTGSVVQSGVFQSSHVAPNSPNETANARIAATIRGPLRSGKCTLNSTVNGDAPRVLAASKYDGSRLRMAGKITLIAKGRAIIRWANRGNHHTKRREFEI